MPHFYHDVVCRFVDGLRPRTRRTLPPDSSARKFASAGPSTGCSPALTEAQKRRAAKSKRVDAVIDALSVGCAGLLGWVILPFTLAWSLVVLRALDQGGYATDVADGVGERISRYQYLYMSHQLSLWLIVGVPFLVVALALIVNFGVGRRSLYYLGDAPAVTRFKTVVLSLLLALTLGFFVAWLMALGAPNILVTHS